MSAKEEKEEKGTHTHYRPSSVSLSLSFLSSPFSILLAPFYSPTVITLLVELLTEGVHLRAVEEWLDRAVVCAQPCQRNGFAEVIGDPRQLANADRYWLLEDIPLNVVDLGIERFGCLGTIRIELAPALSTAKIGSGKGACVVVVASVPWDELVRIKGLVDFTSFRGTGIDQGRLSREDVEDLVGGSRREEDAQNQGTVDCGQCRAVGDVHHVDF